MAAYEPAVLGEAQVETCLDRLGIADELTPNAELLARLVEAHQMRIPFQTVDLVRSGKTPDLSLEVLFQKVVADGHGGYCFELNRMFDALLASLGFKVRPCYCRSVVGRPEPAPINHRGELVLIDGIEHFVDVGFGGPMSAGSIPLVDGQPVTDGRDVFVPVREDEAWWRIDRQVKGADAVRTELKLCTAQVENKDFDLLNTALSLPGTLFHDVEIANLRLPDGYITMRAGVAKVARGGESQEFDVSTRQQTNEFLRTYVGFAPYFS